MADASLYFWPLLILCSIGALVLGHRIVRQPVLGVYVFVFLSSITMMPQLPVVGDRLAVADFVMLFTLLVSAFQGQLFRPVPPVIRLIDHLAITFVFVATVSSLFALMGGGNPTRVFLFLLIYIYGYLCFRLIIRLIDSPERFVKICLWWAAGATIVIVVGFLASTGIYKPAWTYDPIIMRINSTMKMSGQVSSYLAPALFILFFLATYRRVAAGYQFFIIGLLGAAALVLLGTGSRISFVLLVIAALYGMLVVVLAPNATVRRSPLIIAAAFGVAIFSGYVVSVWTDTSEQYGLMTTSPFERAIKIFSESSEYSGDVATAWGGTRYREISLALETLEDHLLFGVGSGMFSSTYRVNEIHNTYVSILSENGVIAFMMYLFWWGLAGLTILRSAYLARGENRLVLRLVFGAFLVLSIYQMSTNGMRQRPFWFVPAVAVAAVAISRRGMPLASMPFARPDVAPPLPKRASPL